MDLRFVAEGLAALRLGRLARPLTATLFFAASLALRAQDFTGLLPGLSPGLGYTNYRVANVPWSIHVVSIDRKDPSLSFHSFHSRGTAIGMATLSDQIRRVDPTIGKPVAAINGDFYQRERVFAGDPRGIQIIEGELVSGPRDRATMWIDTNGQPHLAVVSSRFTVAWPDGTSTPFDLNGELAGEEIQLYSPALGASTHSEGARELILEKGKDGPWLPLQIGKTYNARIREVRSGGDSEIAPGTLVLSAGPGMAFPDSAARGASIKISLATVPDLTGARSAISGGPTLIRAGKRQKISARGEGYESSSMTERHPRTAIGWNKDTFYFVEVDGRQKGLSAGMTLDEMSAFLAKLGCEEGMNLDGGGSATLWAEGQVRNKPCDGHERMIANSLMVVRSSK